MPTEEHKPVPSQPVKPAPEPPKKRDVVITGQFKKDMKRERKGRHRATLRADVQAAVDMLADDIPLPAHMVDHPLGGNWKDHRDCHIRPDLVLIYRKSTAPKVKAPKQPDKPKLHLVRIGSHSELGI